MWPTFRPRHATLADRRAAAARAVAGLPTPTPISTQNRTVTPADRFDDDPEPSPIRRDAAYDAVRRVFPTLDDR